LIGSLCGGRSLSARNRPWPGRRERFGLAAAMVGRFTAGVETLLGNTGSIVD
jgi:hypothetical protein